MTVSISEETIAVRIEDYTDKPISSVIYVSDKEYDDLDGLVDALLGTLDDCPISNKSVLYPGAKIVGIYRQQSGLIRRKNSWPLTAELAEKFINHRRMYIE